MPYSTCLLDEAEVKRRLKTFKSSKGWKFIPGYPGFEINKKGEVRSWWMYGFPGELVEEPHVLEVHQHRYPSVNVFRIIPTEDVPVGRVPRTARDLLFVFSRETVFVHRLLLMAYVRLPKEGEVASFKKDKTLKLENLEWRKSEDSFR